MKVAPYTKAAHDLLHQGAIALARVEADGICVDVPYVQKALADANARVKALQEELAESEVMRVWRKAYRTNMNVDSGPQLADVLYNRMGFTCPGLTAKGGKPKVDEDSLVTIDHPFIKAYIEIKKIKKAVSTNLKGILREVVDGKIHCFYNLHNVISYRSSSDSFNFQNLPKHDPDIAKLIRTAFIARPGNHLVEIDFSGAEVRVGESYHKDQNMLAYIQDPSTDMHRDAACELFFLKPELFKDKRAKPLRQLAKSSFVFAEFYGDWYMSTAKGMWQNMHALKVAMPDGTPLPAYLAKHGITRLGDQNVQDRDTVPGTFEHHVREVERWLWEDRFPGYAQWKRDQYAAYQKQGWFDSYTGFAYQGYMRRNAVNNYPIQGSSFHCLLWSLIRLVMEEIPRRGMASKVVGQIHDSIVLDVAPSELPELMAVCRKVMLKQLRVWAPWLIVPMEVEVEISPVGGSWYAKEEFKWN